MSFKYLQLFFNRFHDVARCLGASARGPARQFGTVSSLNRRSNPGYIVDDQGALRKHLAVFIDGRPIRDRQRLSDALAADSRVYVVQALSGG